MINTYNESSLHRTLKNIYSFKNDGETEKKIGNFIFDIVEKDGNVIEIQTANISALFSKTNYILENGKKIKIVHPVIEKKYIVNVAENGKIISKKASPKTETFFDSLRGLTKMCIFFGNQNFELELVFVEILEVHQKVSSPTQIQNKSRRHLKDWIPKGKKLEKIIRTVTLKREDYIKMLIPESIPDFFTVKELQSEILMWDKLKNFTSATKKRAASFSSLAVWILKGAGFLKEIEKKELLDTKKLTEAEIKKIKSTKGKIYSIQG